MKIHLSVLIASKDFYEVMNWIIAILLMCMLHSPNVMNSMKVMVSFPLVFVKLTLKGKNTGEIILILMK